MKAKQPRSFLISAVIMLAAAVMQCLGLIRYLDRMPGDLFGIAMYVVTIALLLIGATGFYLNWKKHRIHYFL